MFKIPQHKASSYCNHVLINPIIEYTQSEARLDLDSSTATPQISSIHIATVTVMANELFRLVSNCRG